MQNVDDVHETLFSTFHVLLGLTVVFAVHVSPSQWSATVLWTAPSIEPTPAQNVGELHETPLSTCAGASITDHSLPFQR